MKDNIIFGIVWFFIFAIIIIFASKCTSMKKERYIKNECYQNRYGTIVKMNESQSITNDKFHTPILVKSVLIQDKIDPTLFVELNTYNHFDRELINKVWRYNHRVGDEVYFEYISKERYFHIYNQNK